MSRTDHLEREVKLAADLHFELPDLRPIVGGTVRLPEQALFTTYFDTADLRLWERGMTLRFRSGETSDGGKWTLKLPQGNAGVTLDRTELSWPGDREHIPEEAMALLHGIVRRAVLREVVELESTRQRIILRTNAETSLGEIDDDVVTVKGGTRKGYMFRQIELEVTDDTATEPDLKMIDGVLRELRRAGARVSAEQKFAKSLGLQAPGERSMRPANRHSTIGSVVRHAIGDGLERALDHDVPLRLRAGDPPEEAVHQARVATRRLRSDLKTFSSLLDPVWLEHTSSELKWLGEVLGRVRDADVLSRRLVTPADASEREPADAETEAEGLREIQAVLARERHAAAHELADAMETRRYLDLLDRLAAGAQAPPFRDPGTASRRASDLLPTLVHYSWRTLRHRVEAAGSTPTDTQLHKIRIGAKQVRYAAEAASPVMGKVARRTARRAEHLQTILGDHHDAVGAVQWFRHVAGSTPPLASFVAGELAAQARQEQVLRKHEWKGVWRRARSSVSWLK